MFSPVPGLVIVAAFGTSKAGADTRRTLRRRCDDARWRAASPRDVISGAARSRSRRAPSRRGFAIIGVYFSLEESPHAYCCTGLHWRGRAAIVRRIARTRAAARARTAACGRTCGAGPAACSESRLGRAGHAHARERVSRRGIRLPVRLANRRSANRRTARAASRRSASMDRRVGGLVHGAECARRGCAASGARCGSPISTK